MKKVLMLLAGLSLLTGCTTVKMVGETAQKAVVEVQDEHTPEEWAAFYSVLATMSGKAEEIARTKTGSKVFGQIKELATERAEQWRSK